MIVPEDVQGAVKPDANQDFGTWWRQRDSGREKLEELGFPGNGPIMVSMPRFFMTEDVRQVDSGSRTMDVGEGIG